jgi:hypothetical protein
MGGRMEIHAIFPEDSFKVRALDGDDTLSTIRRSLGKQCRLQPVPRFKGKVYNTFFIGSLDDKERYLELNHSLGYRLFIPVRRILDLQTPPDGNLLTLRHDGSVQVGIPGENDCKFTERLT